VFGRILLGALGGVLLALAFEPVAIAWLAPVGVAAFLLCVRGLRTRSAWLPGLAFGVAFEFVLQYWMRAVGTDAWLALSALEAAFFAPLGSVTVVLMRRRWWPLWTALAWVAAEVVRSSWPFGGMPWGRLAFATVDTPFASALPYVGANGVSLLLALLGSTLAWVLVSARERTVPAVSVAGPARTSLPALAVLGVVGVVAWLPSAAPYAAAGDGSVTVATVQGNVPGDGSDILLDHRQVTRNHLDATTRLARDIDAGLVPRPDFVIWPENSTAVDPFRDAEINGDIEAASAAVDVPILVGGVADAPDPGDVLNQGIVWVPGVGGGERYTKRHPVPFGEYIPWRDRVFKGNFGRLAEISRDMLSGTRTEPLAIAGVRVADAICFDVAYDDGIREQIERGGQLLVVQTSNATFIHTDQIRQQFAITRLRAIETHRAVAVAATNGLSGLIGPDGEVLDTAAPRTQAVLVGTLPLSEVVTPGVRLGPWIGRGAVAVTLAVLLLGWVPYRRVRSSAQGRNRT
jgi:apolipoprotein N-acyltransferase